MHPPYEKELAPLLKRRRGGFGFEIMLGDELICNPSDCQTFRIALRNAYDGIGDFGRRRYFTSNPAGEGLGSYGLAGKQGFPVVPFGENGFGIINDFAALPRPACGYLLLETFHVVRPAYP